MGQGLRLRPRSAGPNSKAGSRPIWLSWMRASDRVLARAGLAARQIDHVFVTGGSSLIPAVRALFERRFGADRIARRQ